MAQTVVGRVGEADWPRACMTHVHLLGGPVETPLDGTPEHADLHLVDSEISLRELVRLRDAGVGAVVEMSCLDFNRSLTGMRDLSLRSGVLIVATTGFRRGSTAAAAGYPADWGAIADRLRRDVHVGEDGVRVGVLKAGSGRGELDAHDVAVLRAAATVHAETGLPISTHSEHGELIGDQLRVLERHGADLRRVAVGHVDRVHDLGPHRHVLETGAHLLYDQIGKTKYHNVDEYASLLRWVDESRGGSQLLLSSDFGRRSYFATAGGEPGLNYLIDDFRTAVIDAGVRPGLISDALGINAWRFLSLEMAEEAQQDELSTLA